MSGFRYKVEYVPWWRPRRLAMRNLNKEDTFDFVGWVWSQKAYLVNNQHHGWIAFVEDQTEANLTQCPYCKQIMPKDKK